MRTNHRFHIQKIFKTFFYLSIPLLTLNISFGFAGWISFENGRAGSYVESKALLNHTSLTAEQSGCNLSVNVPGTQVLFRMILAFWPVNTVCYHCRARS